MAAATTVVSGRIDAATAAHAAAKIKSAGLTVGEVIKRVWDNIAATGELPEAVAPEVKASPLEKLRAFQAQLPPMDDWFINMTDDQMKEILGERDV